jgi:hypothetical protein
VDSNGATANTLIGGNYNETVACTNVANNCSDQGDTFNDSVDGDADTMYGGNRNNNGTGNDLGAPDTFNSTTTPDDNIITGNDNNGVGAGADTNGGTATGTDDLETIGNG